MRTTYRICATSGGGGAPPKKKKEKAKFSLQKLKDCAHDNFGADIQSLTTDGLSATITGRDVVSNGGASTTYTITFDFSQTGAQIAHSGAPWNYGYYDPLTAYTVFIANDIAAHTGNNNPIVVIATQIHELGNALQHIGGVATPPANPPDTFGDTDPGVILERCVFGGTVGDDGRVTLP
jgi:hypothetical protein